MMRALILYLLLAASAAFAQTPLSTNGSTLSEYGSQLAQPAGTLMYGAYRGNGSVGTAAIGAWEDYIGHRSVMGTDALAATSAPSWTGGTGILSNVGYTIGSWRGSGYRMDFQLPMLPQDSASFSGYASGTTLFVTTAPATNYLVGQEPQLLSCTGCTAGTIILSQTSGTAGGVGQYLLDRSNSVGSSGSPLTMSSKSTLALGASGSYNSVFYSIGQQLVTAGFPTAIIRLGWEFNGNYYPWYASQDPTSWTAYWQQIVTTLRSVPGQRFLFDYNPTLGTNAISPFGSVYPGDSYVDIIGEDIYDKSYNGLTPQTAWAANVGEADGLQAQANFAAAHNKFLSYPEVGVGNDYSGGNFTGYIDNGSGSAGTVLHVVGAPGFSVQKNMILTCSTCTLFTAISADAGGGGGAGAYTVNMSQAVGSSASPVTINARFSFGDDPYFVQQMYAWMTANRLTPTGGVLYYSWWDYSTPYDFSGQLSGVNTITPTSFPNSSAEWLATFGASLPTYSPAPPAGVTTLAVGTQISPTTLPLSWSKPASAAPIEKYIVMRRVTGSSPWTYGPFLVSSATSLTASSLTPGTQYDFEIETLNRGGESGYSTIVNGTTLASTYPGIPQYFSANSASSSAVNFGWTAPADGTTPTSYTLQYRVHGQTSWNNGGSTTSTGAQVSSLNPSTLYDFQIYAVTAAGNGSPTTPIQYSTTAQATTVPPSEVTFIQTNSKTTSTIVMSWPTPTLGGPVSYYSMFIHPATTRWAASTAFAAGAVIEASHTVTQLDLYQSGTGAGCTSGTSAPIWPASGSVADGTCTWTYQGPSPWSVPSPATTTNNSYTYTGLTTGTTYDFYFSSCNIYGCTNSITYRDTTN